MAERKDRPAARSTCPRCQATWTALDATHCPTCHVTYSDVAAFDAHRKERVCRPVNPEVVPSTAQVHNRPQLPDSRRRVTEPIPDVARHPELGGTQPMAEVTEVRTLDDLFGAEGKEVDGAKEITFGIDGKSYDIDLVDENEAKLRDALAPFLAVARLHRPSAPGRTSRRTPGEPRSRRDRNDAKAVREWAVSRNMQVSERGRIPSSVQEAYDLAHQG